MGRGVACMWGTSGPSWGGGLSWRGSVGHRGGIVWGGAGARLWVSPTALFPTPPQQFHYDHNRAQFYVEDASTASALKQVSRKITDCDNYKVGRERSCKVTQGDRYIGW